MRIDTRIVTWFGAFTFLMCWVAGASAAPKVEVLNAGSGAKAPLAFDISAGSEQSMGMSWTVQFSMDMAGFKVDMNDFPAVNMRFSAASPNGTQGDIVEYTTTLNEVSFASSDAASGNPMVDEMKADLLALNGMTSLVKAKSTGELVSNTVQRNGPKSDSMGQQLLNSMDQAAILFPTQPLGVGAKWTITEDVDQQGVKVRRTTTLELKERKGQRATIGVSIHGDVLSKTLENATGLPPGSLATIDSFVMAGKGNMVYDLTRLFPISSDVTVNVDTTMKLEAQGQTANASSGIRFTVKIQGD